MTVGGWQWTHYIHVDMSEPSIWASESSQRGLRVACYFRSLATEAGFGPVADIHVHAGPHETGADEFQGGSNTGVREPMDGVKNSSPHVSWNKGPWFAGGYVTEYRSVTGWQGKSLDL